MICRAAVLFVFCALAAARSFAQELPKPGPEHEKLKELVGEWDAEMDMQGQKSKCKAVYKSICGGMWVESNFTGSVGGIEFSGHGLDGYDLRTKKYVGIWIDSMGSAPLHMEGEKDTSGKLVMTGDSTNLQGQKEKFKAVTELKDKDHFTFKMYMLEAGQENLAFTIEYTRKN